jgi:hypothetical protein
MQFGRALTRIPTKIVWADPCHGPVQLIKVDVANRFYCIHLALQHMLSLGVAFPPRPDGAPLIALPLVLPMGWVKSRPFFCIATKTIADLANANLQQGAPVKKHRLRDLEDTQKPTHLVTPTPKEKLLAQATVVPNHLPGPQ